MSIKRLLTISFLFIALSMNAQTSAIPGYKYKNTRKVWKEYSMSYMYKTSAGGVDTLRVPSDSSEYIILYITTDVIEVINRDFLDLLNKDALYSLLDVRSYGSTGNPFLGVDFEQLYGAFTQVLTKKE